MYLYVVCIYICIVVWALGHNPEFDVGDYVFINDRSIIYTTGTTRPLKSQYDDTSWTILRINPTSALGQRLGDGIVTLYSYDDIKKNN